MGLLRSIDSLARQVTCAVNMGTVSPAVGAHGAAAAWEAWLQREGRRERCLTARFGMPLWCVGSRSTLGDDLPVYEAGAALLPLSHSKGSAKSHLWPRLMRAQVAPSRYAECFQVLCQRRCRRANGQRFARGLLLAAPCRSTGIKCRGRNKRYEPCTAFVPVLSVPLLSVSLYLRICCCTPTRYSQGFLIGPRWLLLLWLVSSWIASSIDILPCAINAAYSSPLYDRQQHALEVTSRRA